MNNEYENATQDLEEDWAGGEPNFHSHQASDIINDGKVPPAAAIDPPNQADTDDWTMKTMVSGGNVLTPPNQVNAENRATETLNTNPLRESKEDKWQMPEPVFRVSSGKKLNKSVSPIPYVKQRANQPPVSSEISEPAVSAAPPVAAADIQPQPYISEDFIVDDVVKENPVRAKSKVGRIILIAAGILAMIVFAVAFLIGIYFLFFR